MSFVSRLVDLVRTSVEPALDPALSLDVSDDQLATAALLVHVARVDGRIDEAEHGMLVSLLGSGFGLTAAGAEALLQRADRFDFEVDDVAALVEMVEHDAAQDGERLLAMAYRVAAADGAVAEFEDDLIWRMGQLLGLPDAAIERIRTTGGKADGTS